MFPQESILIKKKNVYCCRHEGRSWYTTHRGVLWIAAAAKVPTPSDIQAEEKHHREMLGSMCWCEILLKLELI